MRAEYTVTYKDFLDSMKSYRKVAKGAAFVYLLDVWILPLFGSIAALYWLVAFLRGDKETADAMLWFAVLGILLAIVIPPMYWLKLRQVYKQRTAISDGGRVAFSFDENEVRFALPERVNVTYSWTVFTHFFETRQTATLFVKKAAFHTIPKRAMSDEELGEFRALIQKHGLKS